MEREFFSGSQAIDIEVTMSTTNEMATARCTGMMAVYIKAVGSRDCNMVKAFFRWQMEESRREFSRKTSFLRKKL